MIEPYNSYEASYRALLKDPTLDLGITMEELMKIVPLYRRKALSYGISEFKQSKDDHLWEINYRHPVRYSSVNWPL